MKKYLIIFILTISILTSSLIARQRKAEAILPFFLYVSVQIVIGFIVGKLIYTSMSGDIYMAEVNNYDPYTGTIGLEWNENSYSHQKEKIKQSPLTKNVYPEKGGWEDNPVGSSLGGTLVESAEFEEYSGNIISDTDLVAICDDWPNVDYCTYKEGYNIENNHAKSLSGYSTDGISGNINDTTLTDNPPLEYNTDSGGMGGVYSGTIDDYPIEFYEFLEDVPNLPNCFDGIQNQDETGIDYGGVCGTGDPVAQPAQNFTDNNVDGIDDISGLSETGSIPMATPAGADAGTYDPSLPGDIRNGLAGIDYGIPCQ